MSYLLTEYPNEITGIKEGKVVIIAARHANECGP
jgi:hypothetical protein